MKINFQDQIESDIPSELSQFRCKVKQLHFFPTFLELEYGVALNGMEMKEKCELGTPLHLTLPQYFEWTRPVSVALILDVVNRC